jgi:hypothetical protein
MSLLAAIVQLAELCAALFLGIVLGIAYGRKIDGF